MNTRTIIAVGALAATTLLGACGDDDDPAGTVTDPEVSLRQPGTDTGSDSETGVEAGSGEQDGVDVDSDTEDVETGGGSSPTPVASKDFDTTNTWDDPLTLRVEVLSLGRSGDVVRMELRVTNLDDSLEWSPHSTFGSGYNLSEVSLIDLSNDLRYLVLTDSEGECVCSYVGGVALTGGAHVGMQAMFPAPPADVSEVEVQLGELGVMGPVPVSDR